MREDAVRRPVPVNLRDARTEAVALINDCKRLISIWTRVRQEAVAANNQERANRITQLISDCEMKLTQAEDRLQAIQGLIDAEERARDA